MRGWAERRRLATLAGLAALAALTGACADTASTRDVRATIVDETGAPIPGAIFYVEVYDDSGPFAFEGRVAGRAGEVPDSAYEPMKLSWRPGARVSLVAFAPGRATAVIRPGSSRPRTDGVLIALAPATSPWNPDLAELAFPFEAAPALAARLSETGHAPLLAAFRSAWGARPTDAGRPLSPSELQKLVNLGLR